VRSTAVTASFGLGVPVRERETMHEMKRRRRLGALGLAAATAILAAGCTSRSAGGDKAGGSGEPAVLRLAARDELSVDLGTAYFVRRVVELSGGTLRIEAVSGWGGTAPTAEQNIVRGVAAGRADLGSVGTRVFDTLGVRSFQALTAPMLIDSYPLEQAVIASDIPARMLEGLGVLKVTGLAVLGDGLRKPIAVKGPLLGPADWQGITFAAFRSQGQAAAVQALGARSTDLWSTGLSGAIASGEVQGLENNLLVYQAAGRAGSAPFVTANVNLWPRTVALVANPDRLTRLTDEQQGWLRQAAADAAAHSTSLVEHEDQIVTDLCKAGARFANASQADLAALRAAFHHLYATLEQDPQTKSFIAGIEELKGSTPSGPHLDIPAGCTGSTPGATATNDPIAGTWTTEKITKSEWVRAFIAAGGSEKEAHASFGAIDYAQVALRFQDGSFAEFESSDGGSYDQGYNALYKDNGNGTLTLWSGDCTHPARYRYDLAGNTLRLHTLTQCSSHDAPYNTTLFATFPFTRSG
jgi:TRAP-type C4-dicarboxylate transport system substrate-binding protein